MNQHENTSCDVLKFMVKRNSQRMIKLDSTQVHKSYFDYTTYLEEFTDTTDHLKITILMFSFFSSCLLFDG